MPADGGKFVHWSKRHPRVGEDDELGEELGDDFEVLGVDEVSGLKIIRPRGGGRRRPPPCGCPGRPMRARRPKDDDDEVGGEDDDDELSADEEAELGAIDDEIDEVGDDDDDEIGDDGQEDVGASYRKLERRRERLLRLKSKLEVDLKTTPARRRKKRKKLQRRIDKIEAKLAKIDNKKRAKVAKGAAATGRSTTETKRAMENGEWNVWARREGLLGPEAKRGFQRYSSASTATGARTTIRLLDSTSGDDFSAVTFAAAGVGHRSSTIGLVSDQISYERLRVVGIEVSGQVAPALVAGAVPVDVAPQLAIVTLMRDGYADQVTTETSFQLTWTTSPGGLMIFRGVWDGLRQPIFLDKRDTVTASIKIGQLRTNVGQIDWTTQATLICDILSDDQLQ